MNDFKIHPLFSTPLYHTCIKNYVNDVIDFNNIQFDNFFQNSNQFNTLNSINQNILDEIMFENISNIIHENVKIYVYDILKISKDVNLFRTCSWMLIGYPGSVTSPHIHKNSIFSGIFYLKSEENSGDVIFSTSPSQLTYISPAVSPEVTETNIYNSYYWSVPVKTNDLLIFPSHLNHSVTHNKSDKIRCAIAFNYFLSGTISNKNTQTLNIVTDGL